jgi:transcriptional regulator with XRE-family HTH domain
MSLKTIGDHLRKRRIDLGWRQKEAAEQIGVGQKTVCNWETNATHPEFRYYPSITRFLEYSPFGKPQTLSEELVQYRKVRGLSQQTFACLLRVDPSTLGRWERRDRRPEGKFLRRIESFLDRK